MSKFSRNLNNKIMQTTIGRIVIYHCTDEEKVKNNMENITDIVKNTKAKLSYVCEGKVLFQIEIDNHIYQLEINSLDDDWKKTYILPEYKSITLMRWIRKGMEKEDGTFIKIK